MENSNGSILKRSFFSESVGQLKRETFLLFNLKCKMIKYLQKYTTCPVYIQQKPVEAPCRVLWFTINILLECGGNKELPQQIELTNLPHHLFGHKEVTRTFYL